MARFVLQRDPPENPEMRSLYQDIVQNGFGQDQNTPINFFTSLAVRPDLLAATWKLAKAVLVEGSLPGSVKQMIALSISRQNDCRYCSVVHRGALEAFGVDSTIVEACATDPDTSDLPDPQRTIVQFTLKAAREPQSITDEDFEALRTHGLSEEEIAEVLMMAAFTNFINAWSDISGIPLDGGD